MHCTKCGKIIPEGKKFCIYCGSPVKVTRINRVEDSQKSGVTIEQTVNAQKEKGRIGVSVFCTNCGKSIPDGKNFCVYCGAPIRGMINDTKLNEQKKKSLKKGVIAAGLIAAALLLVAGFAISKNNESTPVMETEDNTYETSNSDYDSKGDNSMSDYDSKGEISMSESEAQEEGGLFVKSDELFYPLQETNVVNQTWESGFYDGSSRSLYYMNSSDVHVPSLTDSDQLVCFSSEDVSDYEALDVKKQGYTMDAVFWNNHVTKGISNATVSAFGELGDSDFEVIEVNGENYESFLNNNTVNAGDYCTSERPKSSVYSGDPACNVAIADLDADEEITLSYYEGTEKQETELIADQEYWITDGCERWSGSELVTTGTKLVVNLGEGPYGTIDVSGLEKGTYIIRANAVSDGYVISIE